MDESGRRARTSQEACAARHYLAIWLLAQGRVLSEVAATTGFAQRWLEQLASRYNAFGPDALGDGRRRNGSRPRLLTPELLDGLRTRLETPPPDGGAWPPPDRSLDGPGTRPCLGPPAAGQRGAAGHRLVAPGPTPQEPGRRRPSKSRPPSKKRAATLAEEEARPPGRPVALLCTDEHRIGLKPATRRVWAPRGQRPTALGHHRYEWLYVTAFVAPATGESRWYVGNGVSKPLFERLLAAFAHEAGAGPDRTLLLLLDGAGWHTEAGLRVPDGLRLVYLPPYTPELQPADPSTSSG